MSDDEQSLRIHNDQRKTNNKGSTSLGLLLDDLKGQEPTKRRPDVDKNLGLEDEESNRLHRGSYNHVEHRTRRKKNDVHNDAYNLGATIRFVKSMYDEDENGPRGRDGLPVNQEDVDELDAIDEELEGSALMSEQDSVVLEDEDEMGPCAECLQSGVVTSCSMCFSSAANKCEEGLSNLPVCGELFQSWFDWCGMSGRSHAVREMIEGVVILPHHRKLNELAFKKFWHQSPADSVLSVRIDHTSMLRPHMLLIHPMVRMYVVNLVDGKYWTKSDVNRAVIAPFENDPDAHAHHRHAKKKRDQQQRQEKRVNEGRFNADDADANSNHDDSRHSTPRRNTHRRADESDDDDEFDSDEDPSGNNHNNKPIEYILPVMTPPCHLRTTGAFKPEWNDEIVVNEPLDKLMKPETLLLFEILDFGRKVNTDTYTDGLFPVAWGFFKLVSNKGKPNYGKLDIQLFEHTKSHTFKAHKESIDRPRVPDVYFDWVWQKNTKRIPYPASLTITVLPLATPKTRVVTGQRPLLPTDLEMGRIDWKYMHESAQAVQKEQQSTMSKGEIQKKKMKTLSEQQQRTVLRKRQGGQCELPTTKLHSISVGKLGAYSLAYSPNGVYLAAACGENLMFTIKLFNTETGQLVYTFNGHHDMVYDLAWSHDSTRIISASSDSSVKIWNIKTLSHVCETNLQHSSYVYAAQFHPTATSPQLVITGAYDGNIRVWNLETKKCVVTLQNHKTNINSICFASNGSEFFSADADGVIKRWEDTVFASVAARKQSQDAYSKGESYLGHRNTKSEWKHRFKYLPSIAHKELKGNAINCLRYHSRPERLVAYTRDDALYSFSFTRSEIQRKMTGVKTNGRQLKCCISPDGKYLVAGSADGKAYFYDLFAGRLISTLDVGFHLPMCDVAWHPTQHLVAFSCFGGDYPVHMYEWTKPREIDQYPTPSKRKTLPPLKLGNQRF